MPYLPISEISQCKNIWSTLTNLTENFCWILETRIISWYNLKYQWLLLRKLLSMLARKDHRLQVCAKITFNYGRWMETGWLGSVIDLNPDSVMLRTTTQLYLGMSLIENDLLAPLSLKHQNRFRKNTGLWVNFVEKKGRNDVFYTLRT